MNRLARPPYAPAFEELVLQLCTRPWDFVTPVSYGTVCAFLEGFDMARDGGPLLGFREWLAMRGSADANTCWPQLAECLLVQVPDDMALPEEERPVRGLLRLLEEFIRLRHDLGVDILIHEYVAWRLQ